MLKSRIVVILDDDDDTAPTNDEIQRALDGAGFLSVFNVEPPGVRLVLDLSNAHIPEEESDQPSFGVRSSPHEHGWIVFPPEPPAEGESEPEAFVRLEVPPWFQPVLALAWREHCILINFDRDATTHPDLPSYDW